MFLINPAKRNVLACAGDTQTTLRRGRYQEISATERHKEYYLLTTQTPVDERFTPTLPESMGFI